MTLSSTAACRCLVALAACVLAGSASAQPAGIPDSPSYRVQRAPVDHDGLLDATDAAWQRAQVIAWGDAPYETRFRALWGERGLYVRWDADDPSPWHTMTRRDDRLWEEEVVEIFLDPSWKGMGYWELEINPANVVVDVRMTDVYPNVTSDVSWDHGGIQRVPHQTAGRARAATGRRGEPGLVADGQAELPRA
jgi:hypothetical protein